jgi:hypothetical protein
MKLYAYCLSGIEARKPDDLTGLFGQKVYGVTEEKLTAFVSDMKEDSVAVTKESVLTHQRVVAGVLEHTSPLPFRFGTVASEADLRSFLSSRQEALLKKLATVDGCVEMSVKVIWQNAGPASMKNFYPDPPDTSGGVGTAFLREKSKQIAGGRELQDQGTELASWFQKHVAPFVRDARATVTPSQKLVLAADCLVERSRVDSYRTALDQARQQRPDLHFLISGPWAPYSFANIDLEFKTQFGVS